MSCIDRTDPLIKSAWWESCLALVAFSDVQRITCTVQVQHGVDGGTRESIQGGVSEWKWVAVFNHDLTVSLVVATGTKSNFFLDNEETCRHRRSILMTQSRCGDTSAACLLLKVYSR